MTKKEMKLKISLLRTYVKENLGVRNYCRLERQACFNAMVKGVNINYNNDSIKKSIINEVYDCYFDSAKKLFDIDLDVISKGI